MSVMLPGEEREETLCVDSMLGCICGHLGVESEEGSKGLFLYGMG